MYLQVYGKITVIELLGLNHFKGVIIKVQALFVRA